MASSVEVTLTSANDLKNVNWRYGPLIPYAVVWVNTNPDHKLTTNVDREGDTCPTWNQKLVLPLTRPVDDDTTLHIDIVHAANPTNEPQTKPLIGSAKLRLREILDESAGSYSAPVTRKLHLKRPSGRPHGKVYIEAVVRDGRYAAPPYQYGAAVREYGYDAPPPAPAGQYGSYPYSAPPPAPAGQYGSYPYSTAAAAPYSEAPPPQGYYGSDQQAADGKKSKFGGMGTGLAVGAVAGLVGGIALVEGYDAVTDHIADEAADKVEEEGDYDDDGGDW